MSEFQKSYPDKPMTPTGHDFIYVKNKLTEIGSLGRGQQGRVYRGVFETQDHIKQTMVIKDFFGKDTAAKESQCRFVSQTAALFREAGLPVLPIVKSVLTTKDFDDFQNGGYGAEMASLRPPFVVMSFLEKEDPNEMTRVLEFKIDGWELFDSFEKDPKLGDGLVSDLATMHALGYTRSLGEWTVDETDLVFLPHPIGSLWLFKKNKTGGLDRWIVDLSNLIRIKDLSPADRLKTNPDKDLKDLIYLLTYFDKIKQRENDNEKKYEQLYKKVFEERVARRGGVDACIDK